jgi:hypothetical protein
MTERIWKQAVVANFGQYPGIRMQGAAKWRDTLGSPMTGTDEKFKIIHSRAWSHQLGQ